MNVVSKKSVVIADKKQRTRVTIYIKGHERHNLESMELFRQYFRKLLKEIHKMSHVRRTFINIEYHPTHEMKTMPNKKGGVLGVDHINSGVSFPYRPDNDSAIHIMMFRQEEFYKVLTHEMLHIYHVVPDDDIRLHEMEHVLKHAYSPRLAQTISLNEAFTELNALLIYIKLMCEINKKDEKDAIVKELQWSKHLCTKLRRHFDIRSDGNVNEKFQEKGTHAFSYIFLKTYFLEKLSDSMIHKRNKTNSLQKINKKSLRMTIHDIENTKST